MDIVIGANNMLGAHTICSLLKKGKQVRALKRKNSNTLQFEKILSYYFLDFENIYTEIEWVEADPFDKDSLIEALEDAEVVYNCTWPVIFQGKKHSDVVSVNVEATSILIDAAIDAGVEYFCHVSNVAALGDEPECKEISENSERNPKAKYSYFSQAAFLSEMEVWRGFEEGLKGAIISPSVILGPGDWCSDYSSIIKKIDKGINFYTQGVTGFVGVNDVVECMLSLTKQKIYSQKYIVSSQNLCFSKILFDFADCLKVKRPKYNANKFILTLAKYILKINTIFTKKNPKLTDDLINTLTNFKLYSNEKSINTLTAGYQPIDQVIEEICDIYQKNKQRK
ncbi:MAG: NAD-dependent epimerase/dehydratase family protein [Bacteroidales bacterium]|nr:NAD-dependent epimerase/dehydratase family protein [Bacteroidales bacterium]